MVRGFSSEREDAGVRNIRLQSSLQRTLATIAIAWCMAPSQASADRITVDGETWNDVLVYKSSTMYYVKVPEEGVVFNVPMNDVSPSNVIIESDPYYRDELRKRYEDNAGRTRSSGSEAIGGSVFSENAAASPQSAAAETPSAAPNPLDQLETMLSNFGYIVTKPDGDFLATSGDGATTLRIPGGTPAGGIEYDSTVPEDQAASQMVAFNLLGGMAAQAGAAWVTPFLTQEVAPLLETGGTKEKSEGPIAVKANVDKADGNITVKITAKAPAG